MDIPRLFSSLNVFLFFLYVLIFNFGTFFCELTLSFMRLSTCKNISYLFIAVNVPRRDYQFSITRTALFSNTLVVLPTGLGKTLIAAVVMYNFFRWFPEGNATLHCFSLCLFLFSSVTHFSISHDD